MLFKPLLDGQKVTVVEEIITHQTMDPSQINDNLLAFQNEQPWMLQLKLQGYYHWPLGHSIDYQSAKPVVTKYKLYPFQDWISIDHPPLNKWKFFKYQIKLLNLECDNGYTMIKGYIAQNNKDNKNNKDG